MLLAALGALPLWADTDIDDKVQVVTQNGAQPDCLAPVAINRIDGEKQVLPARGFLIEPGVHTINGRVTLDSAKCHPMEVNQHIGKAADLEVNFEPGRIYYIAYDRSALNTEEWSLVVWKVEYPDPLLDYIQPSDNIQ